MTKVVFIDDGKQSYIPITEECKLPLTSVGIVITDLSKPEEGYKWLDFEEFKNESKLI